MNIAMHFNETVTPNQNCGLGLTCNSKNGKGTVSVLLCKENLWQLPDINFLIASITYDDQRT